MDVTRSNSRFPLAAAFVLAGSALLMPSTLRGQSTPAAPENTPTPSATPAAPVAQSAPTTPVPELPDGPESHSTVQPPLLPTGPTALIDTSMGRLSCKLYDKQAPLATANFIGLANGTKDWVDPKTLQKVHGERFYDGTTFHRVIPGFMIQGGDRAGDGTGDPGYFFQDEFDPRLRFDVPGRLAMANSGPKTNGSQFFITEVPVEQLNDRHTIFGQCDAHSVELVKQIARVERSENDRPLTPVVIRKVTIVPDGHAIPADPMAAATPAAAAH